jgi:uncharacterized membrane protein YadS
VTEQTTVEQADSRPVLGYAIAGMLVVIALGALTRFLEVQVPLWASGTPFARIAKSIEFPIYAIALGLIGNAVLTKLALRDALSKGFRTEFFIKTGLVLLGASINLKVLVTAAGRPSSGAAAHLHRSGSPGGSAGGSGLDDKLRAAASAVSICGVSAAIAAAGAVQAKREQLAYAASLVIHSRPRSSCRGCRPARLSDAVAGAWIGGNIRHHRRGRGVRRDRGENAHESPPSSRPQNALIGVVAIALTAYFALKVAPQHRGCQDGQFWERFPKFVLGFIAASIIGTVPAVGRRRQGGRDGQRPPHSS